MEESMKDYEVELEASFRKINEGDVIQGTVIDVNENEVTLDLKYYTQGIIKAEDMSNDPGFSLLDDVKIGDVIEASVVKMDDGQGNILLSKKEANEVLAKVNQARLEIGLSELVWSDELAAAAEIRAQEIHQAFSHTRPDGSPWWTVDSENIYGENIAKGYQSADSVVEAWMESTDHKENILYSGFETIGIAVYNVDGKWYWAQEFGY